MHTDTDLRKKNTEEGINRSKPGTLEAKTQLVSLLWRMSGSQMDKREREGERKRRDVMKSS